METVTDQAAILAAGSQVIWHHEMRGGYGYVERIPAVIVRVHDKRVRIRVLLRSGVIGVRLVKPESLALATADEERRHSFIWVELEWSRRYNEGLAH